MILAVRLRGRQLMVLYRSRSTFELPSDGVTTTAGFVRAVRCVVYARSEEARYYAARHGWDGTYASNLSPSAAGDLLTHFSTNTTAVKLYHSPADQLKEVMV